MADPEVKRAIASKALDRYKARVRDITRRAKGVSLETTIAELAPYMRGWRSYFGFCETPEALVYLTRWVRLRRERPCGGSGKHRAVAEPLCWNSVSVRSWPAIRPEAVAVPGTRTGEGPLGGSIQRVLRIARTSDVDRGVLA
jgi:Group II intron, maturase-specific domain